MKDGDYVVRVWPSGKLTMGLAIIIDSEALRFFSLENYDREGGVLKNDVYGFISPHSQYKQRLATQVEIESFLAEGNLDSVKRYERDMKLKSIGI
jgi:hypothetical protein